MRAQFRRLEPINVQSFMILNVSDMDNEKNGAQAFRVEGLSDEQFGGHLQSLQTPISQLSPTTNGYLEKRMLLQFAIEWRSQSSDNLRIASQTSITAAAVDGQWTVAMKANRLVKLRQNLMKARECFSYAQIGSTDGFSTAQKVRKLVLRNR